MSYILDALRRAETERSRGAVPGLHSQPVPAPEGPSSPHAPGGRRVALVAALALLAAGAAGAAWWWLQRPAAVPSGDRVVLAPAPAPAAPMAAPAPDASAAPASTIAGMPPATRAAAPAPRAQPSAPAERARADDPARSAATGAAPAAVPDRAAPAPRVTGTVFAQDDLPQAVRAQLPNLQIAGVTYSANAAYRMAIVNGQVLHEGDQAAPGLRLERIEPERTVWSFQGYRYGMPSR